MSSCLAKPIKQFFSHYLPVQKGLAANTVAAYRDALKLLLCYAADVRKRSVEELRVEDFDEPLVLAYLDHLETVRGCSARTRNARLAAIRAFFAFLGREDPSLLPQCQTIRAIPIKRTEHKTMTYLEEKETQAVLDAVDGRARMGLRDQALLLVLYNTGARVSEIVNLKASDLRLDDSPQIRLLGKGQKHRTCLLWPETADALRTYLQQRAPQDPACDRLFLNANGLPLTRFGVRYILGKHVTQARGACPSLTDKRVSPHTLRHTTAMHLLRSGNEVNMVSYWLGHADINTTHVYVEIDMEMKRKMLEMAPSPAVNAARPWRQRGILDWLDRLTKPRDYVQPIATPIQNTRPQTRRHTLGVT
jgi:site-specific recombinase XerD